VQRDRETHVGVSPGSHRASTVAYDIDNVHVSLAVWGRAVGKECLLIPVSGDRSS